MISPREFKERWERSEELIDWRLNPFPAESLLGVSLPPDVKTFLTEAGLPDEAAPFLNFKPPKTGNLIRVSDMWRLPQEFKHYRVIGSNGSGDPVCIDEENGEIVYLNHDNEFQRVLMASSIFKLSECLLAVRDFIDEAGGLSNPIIPERIEPLVKLLRSIDPAACEEDGFWPSECQGFTH